MRLIKGVFKKRLNRFVVEAILDNKTVRAHLPNPGRLWELLVPGRLLYLKKERREGLPYTVWATERDGSIICLHTQYTNYVAKRLIEEGRVFEGYKIVKREFSSGRHRFDFLIKKGKSEIPLEVKSVTLFSRRVAMFPDAITTRGRSHIEALARMRGGILFVVHSPRPDYFLPDFHTDPQFSERLYTLRDFIMIKAVSVKWDPVMRFEFVKELSIPWEVYEREAKNQGAYIITGFLDRNRVIEVGLLGMVEFKKGYYLYVGSALNSLSGRINRHMRREKRLKWHIDYLIRHLKNIKAIPIQSSEDLECQIADSILNISDGSIKGFGCSDCRCESHLFWMRDNPFLREEFVNIITKYRIDRLSSLIL
jgi:sugar fermentation stimulation protein A